MKLIGETTPDEQARWTQIQNQAAQIAQQIGQLEIQKNQYLAAYEEVKIKSQILTMDISKRLNTVGAWQIGQDNRIYSLE